MIQLERWEVTPQFYTIKLTENVTESFILAVTVNF